MCVSIHLFLTLGGDPITVPAVILPECIAGSKALDETLQAVHQKVNINTKEKQTGGTRKYERTREGSNEKQENNRSHPIDVIMQIPVTSFSCYYLHSCSLNVCEFACPCSCVYVATSFFPCSTRSSTCCSRSITTSG